MDKRGLITRRLAPLGAVLVLAGASQATLFGLQAGEGKWTSCDEFLLPKKTIQGKQIGQESCLMREEAFSYRGQVMTLGEKGKKSQLALTPVNHFAAEMEHFSQCILENKTPTTPGEVGLADHRVMAAIEESARTGKTVSLKG